MLGIVTIYIKVTECENNVRLSVKIAHCCASEREGEMKTL